MQVQADSNYRLAEEAIDTRIPAEAMLSFDYTIKADIADRKNAIRLLSYLKYPEEMLQVLEGDPL